MRFIVRYRDKRTNCEKQFCGLATPVADDITWLKKQPRSAFCWAWCLLQLLQTAMGRPLARSDKYRDSAMGAGYSLRSIPTLYTLLAAEELFFLMNRDYGVPWEVIRKIREAWWVGCDNPCPFQRLCQP